MQTKKSYNFEILTSIPYAPLQECILPILKPFERSFLCFRVWWGLVCSLVCRHRSRLSHSHVTVEELPLQHVQHDGGNNSANDRPHRRGRRLLLHSSCHLRPAHRWGLLQTNARAGVIRIRFIVPHMYNSKFNSAFILKNICVDLGNSYE